MAKTKYSVILTEYFKDDDSYKFLLIDNYDPDAQTKQYELPARLLMNIVGARGWNINYPERDVGKIFKKVYAINPIATPKKKDGEYVLENMYD